MSATPRLVGALVEKALSDALADERVCRAGFVPRDIAKLAVEAAWCGGTAHPSPVIPGTGLVLVRSDGQDRGAHVGDVMVRDGSGRYRKYGREEFEKVARGWTEVRSLHGGREVREDNLDRLAAWVGGEVIDQGPPIGRGLHFLASEGFHTYAWPGDVIVPEGNGHDVVPASDLIEEFP